MKQKKQMVTIFVYSILLLLIAGVNIRHDFIIIPTAEEMISQQIDYITISTVFAGFSFTTLGLLLGLSSEKLIVKIKNTNIIMNKVGRIICSIVLFLLAVAVSLFFVLGLNSSLINNANMLLYANNILYVLGIGYLIGGIAYFVYAVYELYDLVKCVYSYNKNENNKDINTAMEQMEATRKRMRAE